MRRETKQAVATALATDGPLTVRDISMSTGLAYNTVRSALAEIEAVSDDGYPALWEIGATTLVDNALSSKPSIAKTDKQLSIDLEEHKKWVEQWNKSLPNLEKLIGKLKLYPVDKPKVLIDQLRKVAVPMASLAYALEQVKDSPDWFTLLGGTIEDDQVS